MTVPASFKDRTPILPAQCGQKPRNPLQKRVAGMAFNFSAVQPPNLATPALSFRQRKPPTPVRFAALQHFAKAS